MPVIYDADGSIIREIHYENEDLSGTVAHVMRQDCTGLLNHVRVSQDIAETEPKREHRLIAKIPLTVVEQAMREGWMNDKAKWKAWLNDGANDRLRVWRGRV